MATLLLSAAGAAIGAGFGGSILGLSGAVIGRTIGALIGNSIDQAIFGATSTNQPGARLQQGSVTASTEGAAITRLQGRARLTGQIIWATRFEEQVSTITQRFGKFGSSSSTTSTFEYFANFAVGLCEGPVSRIGRIWADGAEIDQTGVIIRTYLGSEVQLPDPLVEGKEGVGNAPAYRGLAYLVFERLAVGDFGNRMPQITAEVYRAVGDLEPMIGGVCVIPGATEFGYDPVEVTEQGADGVTRSLNRSTRIAASDWSEAMDQLQALAPNCTTVMLVVAWFGDDLRAANCTIRPKVDAAAKSTFAAGAAYGWSVNGLTRSTAMVVSTTGGGGAAYGGSPSEPGLRAAIADLRARGFEVVLCPFVMMDIPAGNTLANPYSASAAGVGQEAYPWRGRITCSPAPGFTGTPDKTAAAATQINTFFTATNGYRAFVLRQAQVALDAGGVDGFLIGSELVGLTTVRSGVGTFPAVDQLVTLAADVRTLLGAGPKIGYAADWSEYQSYRPADGSGDVWFHLDPLWASADIDFVGIDNYLPVSDWRDGTGHLDYAAAGPTSIYDPAYLAAGIEGGEYFDWYYASDAARAAQTRSLITDGVYSTPALYRQKDLRSWWNSSHRNQPGGIRDNLIPNSGDPRNASWTDAAATNNNYTTPFGPFARAVRVLSSGSTTGVRLSGSAAITAGFTYQVSVWLQAGTSGRARLGISCGPSAVLTSVVNGTVAAPAVTSTTAGTIASLVAVDLGGGIWRWDMEFVPVAGRTDIAIGLGPDSAVSGETVILFAADVIRKTSRDASATPWVRQSKPIWFTELGCGAVDKGANEPNAFLDAKSSASALPHFSNGARDDAMQRAFLQAHLTHWAGDAMVEKTLVWAWDARPSPSFGQDAALWADTVNWQRGHWISGRLGSAPAEETLADIFGRAGFSLTQIDPVGSVVDGIVAGAIASPREMIEALGPVHNIQAVETGALVRIAARSGQPTRASIDLGTLVRQDGDSDDLTRRRAQETDLPHQLNVTWSEPTGDDQQASYAAIRTGTVSTRTASQALPAIMAGEKARVAAEVMMRDIWLGRESLSLALPPSMLALEPGDIVALAGEARFWRIEELGEGMARPLSARRADPSASILLAAPPDATFRTRTGSSALRSGRPSMVFIDGPLLLDTDAPVGAYVGAKAQPWGSGVSVYRSPALTGFVLDTALPTPAGIGQLAGALPVGPLWRWDNASEVLITLSGRPLASLDDLALFNGGNLLAIEQTSGEWEFLQFANATLVAANTYSLKRLLRGQRGSEHAMGPVAAPAGARVVLIDSALRRTATGPEVKDLSLNWRFGPSHLDVANVAFQTQVLALKGNGLRPFAPVRLTGQRDIVTGDWAVSWIRRTRFGGDSWALTEVPLNEQSEAYLLEVLNGAGTVVLRSLTLTAPTYAYTAAQQTADFGAPQTSFNARVRQISATFGPGIPATKLIGA